MDKYMKNSNSSNNYFVCPNCNCLFPNHEFKSSNQILEKNYDAFTNNLYSNIKLFYKKLSIIINNIKNITTGLENQAIHSKSLIKLIVVKNNKYIERYHQLSDRIDMINESKKILDYNLSLVNENLNIFVNDINQIFKKMKNKFSQTKNININNSDELKRNIINLNQSPKKALNTNNSNNKFLYKNFENFVNNIKFDEYNHNNNQAKGNNTLIFPNNINQNIFNYTITSREFQKMKNGQNLRFFNYNSCNKNTPKGIENQGNNRYQKVGNKMIRSSSLPDMNKKNIQNNRYEKTDFDYNDVIQLCYKVKDFFDYLNNNTIEESDVLLNKIKEINILINMILDNNNEKNIIAKENFNNINENNKELIKNIEILTKKINDLENKIREKDEYIKYIKKNIN